jgi:hypothetical protein
MYAVLDVLREAAREGVRLYPREIGARCGLADNTTVKNLKLLRDEGHVIEKERVELADGRHGYEYWLEDGQPVEGLRQRERACSCGSWYRRGAACNVCGAVVEALAKEAAFTDGSPPGKGFSREGRPHQGRYWDPKRRRYEGTVVA